MYLLALLLLAQSARTAPELAASGWAAFEAGRVVEAEAQLGEAARLAPENASIALALGQVYLAAGKAKLAVAQLEKVARVPGSPPDVRFALAQAYQASGDDVRVVETLSGTVPAGKLGPTWTFTRAYSLFRMGRYKVAETDLRTILNDESTKAPAHFFLGNCLYAQGKYAESLPYFEQAISAGDVPDNRALNLYHYNYGLAMFQLGRYEKAAQAFRASINRFSQDPLPWFFLGRCHAELRRYPEAIEEMEAAVKLAPDFRLGYYQLARLHSQHGDRQRAAEFFEKVSALREEDLKREEDMAHQLKTQR